MKEKTAYPREFIETCNRVNEKIAKKRAILSLELLEKKQVQMICYAIIFLMLFIIIAFTNHIARVIAWCVLVSTAGSLMIYTGLAELKILKKKVNFKEDVLKEFTNCLNDGFIYEKNGEISESKYRKSGFNRTYNDFYSNCFIEGKRNGKNIGLANVIVKKRIPENEKKYKQLFKGTFAYCDLNVSIDEIDLMKINSSQNRKEKDAISSENLYMYAEDVKKARKIISPDIIKEIRKIKEDLKTTIELMANKNSLYVRFYLESINNTLSFGTKNEIEILYKYYRMIEFMDTISKKIEYNVTGNNIEYSIEDENMIENRGEMQKMERLNEFRIYPKIDAADKYSKEFEEVLRNSEGVEIQFFNENGYASEINIEAKVDKVMKKYPNIKEITIHPPLDNYDIEHILFKDETIFEKQLYTIIELSDKYGITVNLLYHTHWSLIQHEATGVLYKLRRYLKILEGYSSKVLLENVMLIDEKRCTVLDICDAVCHPNLKACIDTTHLYVRSIIWKQPILEYVSKNLNKDFCNRYVHQIHFATVGNNDGYIDKATHGVEHKNNDSLDFDLKWMEEYNLLNKKFITEVSEENYELREKQLKEIKMLSEEIKKYK